MLDNQIESVIKQFTELTIEGLKELSSRGDVLTIESLYDILSQKPEARKLISSEGKDSVRSGHFDLKIEIDRLNKQKSKLLADLNAFEEKTGVMETTYRRMILFFTGYMEKTSLSKLGDSIKKFKEVIKKKSSIEVLDTVFEDLKKLSFQVEVSETDKSNDKGKSLLSDFFKGRSVSDVETRYIEALKETYQEFIDMLGLDLSETFMERLVDIGKQIQSTRSLDDFQSLRTDILLLLHDYIERVSMDRENVADFIKELGSRLISFEKILISAFENTEVMYSSSNEFTVKLEGELDTMTEALREGKTLEDLKKALTSKFEIMRLSITEKNKRDDSMRKKMDRDFEQMKEEFEMMKNEALEAKQKAELLEKEVITDPLTGTLNRRAYEKRIREEFQRFERHERVFSLLMFDLDYFKNINDTYGHAIGDTCLKVIIERIQPLVRDTDILARFGGEEFVVILPETDGTGVGDVAEKIRSTVENIEFIHRDEVVRVTVSVGCSTIQPSDKTPLDLFGRVDLALYEAKDAGRNTVVVKQKIAMD